MSINETVTIQTTTINAIRPTTGALSVGNTQTTGVLNVGTGVRTAAGVVNLATGTSNACAINILNGGGATTGGSVNIANGASQTTTVNIASGTGTGAVTIGGASNTTTLASATINMNGNLIMGTGDNITLQPNTGYVAPTILTQLGGTLSATILTTAPVNASVYGTLTITTAGIYIFSWNIQQPYTALGTTNYVTLSGAGAISSRTGKSDTLTGQFNMGGVQIVTATATNYLLTLTTNSTLSIPGTSFFRATRIG